MNIQEVLEKIAESNIQLSVESDRLAVHTEGDEIPDDIRELLVAHKSELIKWIRKISILPGIKTYPRDNDIPMSSAQVRLWYVCESTADNCTYNEQLAVELSGKMDVKILQESINILSQRHEMLRTIFGNNEAGDPLQIIKESCEIKLAIFPISATPDASCSVDDQVDKIAFSEGRRLFDLNQGPLWRVALLVLPGQKYILLFTVHHIVADGWSYTVILDELTGIYTSLKNNTALRLTDIPVQYADYAFWEQECIRQGVFSEQINYWRDQLANVPLMNLPYDRTRSADGSGEGSVERFNIGQTLLEKLNDIAQRENVTLFMVLLAAFKSLLMRYSDQKDIAVAIPTANRNHRSLYNLIGHFVNILILRTNLSGAKTFIDVLREVRQTMLAAYSNQDVPFDKVVKKIRPDRSHSSSPLIQVMMVLNTPMKSYYLPGLNISRPRECSIGVAKFDLTVSLEETENSLEGFWEYKTRLFDAHTIRRFQSHFLSLLSSIAADSTIHIDTIRIVSEEEKALTTETWNNTGTIFPNAELFVHDLIDRQALSRGDERAIVSGHQSITYRDLVAKANLLAHYLEGQKISIGDHVGVYMDKSIDFIISLLAIWKTGAVYVPLDPTYPIDRIQFMAQDAELSYVFTQEKYANSAFLKQTRYCLIDHVLSAICVGAESLYTNKKLENNAIIAILYTSGTTGKPKGALLKHLGLSSLVAATTSVFNINAESRLVQFASISFDASLWEIVNTLTCGALLHIAPKEELVPGPILAGYLRQHEISHVFLVPSVLSALPEADLPQLKYVLCGGEILSEPLINIWAKNRNFYNIYGPTETTVYSNAQKCESGNNVPINIGKPLPNVKCYVLDTNHDPVPVGMVGELCIGGPGVTAGYWNRKELTAEKFIDNPFSKQGEKIYKSGDFVRYRRDGAIEFIGRKDQQIKLRGVRVELSEIEVVLKNQNSVIDARVVVKKKNAPDMEIVAYVITDSDPKSYAKKLKQDLRTVLPDFMIPSSIVLINEWPLLPNGKVNLTALPEPDQFTGEANSFLDVPRSTTELELVRIWQNLLNCKKVSIHDNFFDLGGHSLLAVRLMTKIDDCFGKQLPLSTLLHEPTIACLASQIETDFNKEKTWSPIVVLQPLGALPPLFCVHPAGGTVFCYADLAREMSEKKQPMYGIQARGLEENQEPFTDNETMARFYIESIKNHQEQGPYYLMGWSSGGPVAFEMAQQLKGRGEDVAFLGLLDAHVWDPRLDFIDFENEILLLARILTGNPVATLPGSLVSRLRNKNTDEQLACVVEHAKSEGLLSHGVSNAHAKRLVNIYKCNSKAMTKYKPKQYSGSITIFRAEDAVKGSVGGSLGWDKYAKEKTKVIEAVGDHFSIALSPNAGLLADNIYKCITEIRQDYLS